MSNFLIPPQAIERVSQLGQRIRIARIRRGWSVAKLAMDPRGYHALDELNTYSAVVYLQKVNHPGAGQVAATVAAER